MRLSDSTLLWNDKCISVYEILLVLSQKYWACYHYTTYAYYIAGNTKYTNKR
jgi:hypothetical protein